MPENHAVTIRNQLSTGITLSGYSGTIYVSELTGDYGVQVTEKVLRLVEIPSTLAINDNSTIPTSGAMVVPAGTTLQLTGASGATDGFTITGGTGTTGTTVSFADTGITLTDAAGATVENALTDNTAKFILATTGQAFVINGISYTSQYATDKVEINNATEVTVTTSGTSSGNEFVIAEGATGGTNLTKITMSNATTGTGVSAVHFNFSGATTANIEGKTIKIAVDGQDDKNYALYNADGSSDGTYELTNDGWTPSTVNGFTSSGRDGRESSRDPVDAFRYKSSKADYYLSGSAFGTGLTPNGVTVNSSTGVLSITTTSETGSTKLSTARDAFHIRIDNAPSTVTTLKVNGVDFTLKNVDNNTGNGSELVKDGWAKDNDQTFINFDGNFTLDSTSDRDTDTNNIPDGITYTNSGKKFTFDSSTFTAANSFNGITFTAARNWKPVIEAKGLGDNATVSVASSTAVAGGLVKYEIHVETESGQLPAEGYSTSGYAIDDLLNYESESAATVDELGSILDVKPLALDDEFNVSTLFDGQADRSALTSLTHSARHRQKK